MTEVNSLEEFVTGWENELKEIVDTGNTVTAEWLAKIQSEPNDMRKLFVFGEMKIVLVYDCRPEAQAIVKAMLPEGE